MPASVYVAGWQEAAARPGGAPKIRNVIYRYGKSAENGYAACQYMFSYMDCDLSYFRSESDAALTPMLKLHER